MLRIAAPVGGKLEGSARIWVTKGSMMCIANVEQFDGKISVVLALSSGIRSGFVLALDRIRLVGDARRRALLSYC